MRKRRFLKCIIIFFMCCYVLGIINVFTSKKDGAGDWIGQIINLLRYVFELGLFCLLHQLIKKNDFSRVTAVRLTLWCLFIVFDIIFGIIILIFIFVKILTDDNLSSTDKNFVMVFVVIFVFIWILMLGILFIYFIHYYYRSHYDFHCSLVFSFSLPLAGANISNCPRLGSLAWGPYQGGPTQGALLGGPYWGGP